MKFPQYMQKLHLKVQVTQIFGFNIFSHFKNMGSNRGFHKVFSILARAKHVDTDCKHWHF